MKEKFEEHAQDGSAHRVEERLEDLREDLEEHVEDGAAHQFEEQLDQLAAHALWWLEEGSKSQGGHFDQGGVAFQVVLSIIIISSPAFESSSSSSPLTYQVSMCRRFPER